MFALLIAELVAYLSIVMYLASTTTVGAKGQVDVIYNKVPMVYIQEEVLKDSVQSYVEHTGIAPTSVNDLKAAGYLSQNFENKNPFGADYNFTIINNSTTLQLKTYLADEKIGSIYTKHYQGKKYGITPVRENNTSNFYFHDFPLRTQTTMALNP